MNIAGPQKSKFASECFVFVLFVFGNCDCFCTDTNLLFSLFSAGIEDAHRHHHSIRALLAANTDLPACGVLLAEHSPEQLLNQVLHLRGDLLCLSLDIDGTQLHESHHLLVHEQELQGKPPESEL